MKRLFVDTAGWMACADAADPGHVAACAARDEWIGGGGSMVTTDYVIDETLTLIKVRIGLDATETWWHQCEASSRLRIECIDVMRAEKARSRFFRSRDKAFSFTDCTSFVVMQELRIHVALTLDHHFRQAGFAVLPEQTS
jgi:predicted nucleic acid-binding protein